MSFDASSSFNAKSYFAGVSTVVVVMALGFGAGMHMTGFFDGVQEPNKLDRRLAEQADAQRAAGEMKPATAPFEAKAILPGTTTIAANAPSVTAPQAPKPADQSEPAVAPAQRMKQTFAMQPRAAQPSSGFSQEKSPDKTLASPPQPSTPPVSATVPPPAAPEVQTQTQVQPAAPQGTNEAAQPQPAAPDNSYARASDEDVAKVKAASDKAAAERKAAEQKKAMQRKLAADRRQQREARLNAAADWVRGQPLDLGRAPRYVAGDYFGR